MIELKNKVVVITGAAGGLGRSLARECFRRGCHLALIDIDQYGVDELRNELSSPSQRVTAHHLDVSDEAAVMACREEIVRAHGCVNILINNAGISISQLFEEVALSDFRRLVDINFWGAVYCSKFFLPDLMAEEDSALVNIISDFAMMGFPGKTAYGSSKSALMGFTNALRTELFGSSVSVSLVVPPPMNTGLVKHGLHVSDVKRDNEARFLEEHGMPIEKAARLIVNAIQRRRFRMVVGGMMFWIDLVSRLFPTALHALIGRRKGSFDFI